MPYRHGFNKGFLKSSSGTPSSSGGGAPTTPALTGIDVTAQGGSLDVQVGSQITLQAAAIPSGAVLGTVSWTSADELTATVDAATGVVDGVKAGTVTITATSGSITGTADVTVTS